MPALKITITAVALLLSSLPACSDRSEAAQVRSGRGRIEDSAAGTVALGIISTGTYRPTALSNSGSIAGTISLRTTRPDSVVPVAHDTKVCGDSAKVVETDATGNA